MKIETERNNFKLENDKLEAKMSEITADLAEEHSTSTLASERLDAETTERLRLEKELSETQMKNKTLLQTSERLEMELIYAKSDLNGISEDEDDGEIDGGIYKQRYERALKELEFTKRRLQQQHEDDLEQLVALKKQLEKKVSYNIQNNKHIHLFLSVNRFVRRDRRTKTIRKPMETESTKT